MKLAEELYQAGFLSYPRTETDAFDPGMDLLAIVRDHASDARWGRHAAAIASGAMWKPPRPGGHDDKAHPPIHPTRYSAGEADWGAGAARAYFLFSIRGAGACWRLRGRCCVGRVKLAALVCCAARHKNRSNLTQRFRLGPIPKTATTSNNSKFKLKHQNSHNKFKFKFKRIQTTRQARRLRARRAPLPGVLL